MKSLIPFPDTEAFPAKNGSGYRSMAVIFAGFHTLPIYPFKKHYHGNEVYRTAGDGRTGITERNNPCPPNGSGGTAKGEKYEKIPCTGTLFPEYGTVPPYPAAYGKTARTAFRVMQRVPAIADAALPLQRGGDTERPAAPFRRALPESVPHAGDALSVRGAVPYRHSTTPVQHV